MWQRHWMHGHYVRGERRHHYDNRRSNYHHDRDNDRP